MVDVAVTVDKTKRVDVEVVASSRSIPASALPPSVAVTAGTARAVKAATSTVYLNMAILVI